MSEIGKGFGFSGGLAGAKRTTNDDACLWVGRFMQDWSYIENALGLGVRKLVGAESFEGTILVTNMQARDKIFALKTLLHAFSPTKDEDKCAALMNRISAMNVHRNVVAHNMFWHHDSGGVEFSITKAKGKLSFPRVVWTEADFSNRTEEMRAIKKELEAAVAKAAHVRDLAAGARKPQNLFANALIGGSAPTEGLGALGGLYALGQHILDAQSSPTPSPKTEPQMPKAPRKKSPKARKSQKK